MLRTIASFVLLGAAGCALAGLPPPTPEQVAAQAAKKAQADAEAAESKRQLAASMDALATRWRRNAAANGWKAHPPTALPPPPAAPLAVQSVAPAMPAGAAPGTLAARPETIATGAIPRGATASAGGVSRPPQQAIAPGAGGAATATTPLPRPAPASAQRPAAAVQGAGQGGEIPTAGQDRPPGQKAPPKPVPEGRR